MALDFPNPPLTVGQNFTGGGVTWTWDGAKWAPAGLGPGYLPLTGGALTGDLSITGPDANTLQLSATPATIWPGVKFNIVSGKGAWLGSYVGANERWELDLGNGIAESGSNAGSNFQIARYSDGGVFIDDPLIINRANGSAYFTQSIVAPNVIGQNRIDNGDMRIDQRQGSNRPTAGTCYCTDRWYFGTTAANLMSWASLVATTGAPLNAGFPYCLQFKALSAHTIAAADTYYIYQGIEADRVSDFDFGKAQANPVTLSFWAMSSKTGSFSGSLQNYAGTRSYPFSFSLPTANTWTFITLTIPGDTAGTWAMSGNGGSVSVVFDLGSGSTFKHAAGAWATGNYVGVTGGQTIVNTNNATFNITAVKLEIGSVATPWQRKSLAESLTDCQRYYEATPLGVGNLTAFAYLGGPTVSYIGSVIYFNTTKRAQPTVTMYSTGSSNPGVIWDANNATDIVPSIGPFQNGVYWYANLAAPSAANLQGYWTASADL